MLVENLIGCTLRLEKYFNDCYRPTIVIFSAKFMIFQTKQKQIMFNIKQVAIGPPFFLSAKFTQHDILNMIYLYVYSFQDFHTK